MSNEIVIGIDLGTTNSCVSYIDNGKPKIIETPEGNRTFPSVVSFKGGEIIVGYAAKRQLLTNKNTISSIKRKMGTKEKVDIDGKKYTPEEISAEILKYAKRISEDKLSTKITSAVITVPAYFNESQRQATKDAARIAGLEVKRMINEPTSAAMAYGVDKNPDKQIIFVFDLGGGTFDVSVIEVDDGSFQVLATSGDNLLGGDDWDEAIIKYLLDEIKKEHKVDLSKDKMVMQRLKDASEKAKIELSGVKETEINLPFLTVTDKGPINFELKITRDKFEEITSKLLDKLKKPVLTALKDAKINKKDISKVLLVGGSTRIPSVQNVASELLDSELDKSLNPDEVVCIGASIQGGVLTKKIQNILLLDVTPLSLGTSDYDGKMVKIIEKNSTIPTSGTNYFTTVRDYQDRIDFEVYQGESDIAEKNKLLGEFSLKNIERAKAEIPEIEVTFTIDVNGLLTVKAKDVNTESTAFIEIKNPNNLSENEIKKIMEKNKN